MGRRPWRSAGGPGRDPAGPGRAGTRPPRPSAPPAPSEPSPPPAVQDIMELLESDAPLEPGTYYIDPDLDPSTPLRVVYEVPFEGWGMWIGAAKPSDDGDHVGVSITTVSNLVRHGCRNHSWADPPVRASGGGLADVLAGGTPFRVAARPPSGAPPPPQDVSIYGYAGKHLELTVPKDQPVQGEGDDRLFIGCLDG